MHCSQTVWAQGRERDRQPLFYRTAESVIQTHFSNNCSGNMLRVHRPKRAWRILILFQLAAWSTDM